MNTIFKVILTTGHRPEDSEDEKLRKTTLLVMSIPFAIAGFLWGLLYYLNGLLGPGLIPFCYGLLSVTSIVHFTKTAKFKVFRSSQIFLILILPFALQLSLGGFIPASCVILWSIISPLGALVFYNRKQAFIWFVAFVILLSVAFLINDRVADYVDWKLQESFIHALFYMNIVGVSSLIFTMMFYFTGKRTFLMKHLEIKHQWIKEAFESYISPNLVEHLINHPEELKLGGERRECTFVFTDLIGFTSLVERSDPATIVSSLNEYFEGMTKIVFKHEGTISKIVGDAIAVMFSAPVVQEDHAEKAVACALEMDVYAKAFAKRKQKEGVGFGNTRIGVNTGSVIIGNIGSSNQLDYRALGDAINIAARLESVNKYIGTKVCVSQTTKEKCKNFMGRPIGSLLLKGKTIPVKTFEPLHIKELNSKRVKLYKKAFKLIGKSVLDATVAFEKLLQKYPEDALAAFHFDRLKSGKEGTTIILATK